MGKSFVMEEELSSNEAEPVLRLASVVVRRPQKVQGTVQTHLVVPSDQVEANGSEGYHSKGPNKLLMQSWRKSFRWNGKLPRWIQFESGPLLDSFDEGDPVVADRF